MTELGTDVLVTVRYFAAACAAAGRQDEVLTVPLGTTVSGVLKTLSTRNAELARVLERCSYLRDGMAVRNLEIELGSGVTLDVLPPFAGG